MSKEKNSFWKKCTGSKLFFPAVCLLVVILVNVIKSPSFLQISINNGVLYGRLIDIANRGSEIAILAIGMTLTIALSAGTDISVGSVMALVASCCCTSLVGYGVNSASSVKMPIIFGVLFGIFIGGVCGCFNGFMVSNLKVQPMVATLVLYTAARAVGLVVSNNQNTYVHVKQYKYLGNFWHIGGWECPIPTPIFVAAICVILATLLLKKTALGMYIQAVGINPKAARIMGINSGLIIFLCYVICGLGAGIAGTVASSRIYSADSNNIGLNFEMDAILAVALGGNSLAGGKFSLAGSIIGAYTIQALSTTLLAFGVKTEQAPVIKAIVIVIIVVIQAPAIQSYMKNRKARKAGATGGEAVAK